MSSRARVQPHRGGQGRPRGPARPRRASGGAARALRDLCDDLSFDEGEASHKALKSVLDGSVNAASENVLIYATSNRRHLLPERMSDNLSGTHAETGEIHPGEAVEEKDLAVRSALGCGSVSIPSARTSTWPSWRSGCGTLG